MKDLSLAMLLVFSVNTNAVPLKRPAATGVAMMLEVNCDSRSVSVADDRMAITPQFATEVPHFIFISLRGRFSYSLDDQGLVVLKQPGPKWYSSATSITLGQPQLSEYCARNRSASRIYDYIAIKPARGVQIDYVVEPTGSCTPDGDKFSLSTQASLIVSVLDQKERIVFASADSESYATRDACLVDAPN